MNEQELIEQARRQGATHYSRRNQEFYRPGPYPGTWESAMISTTGRLGGWSDEWRGGWKESAVRL